MTMTVSRLMSLSDGGGEPSTQPFQPLRAFSRIFRGGFSTDGDVDGPARDASSSSSSGVRGRFDDVRDVAPVDGERERPGVVIGLHAAGIMGGGGVTDWERCSDGMWMAGRPRGAFPDTPGVHAGRRSVPALAGTAAEADADAPGPAAGAGPAARPANAVLLSPAFPPVGPFPSLTARFPPASRSSTALYGGTPWRTLVRTSRSGRASQRPARTSVAVRRKCLTSEREAEEVEVGGLRDMATRTVGRGREMRAWSKPADRVEIARTHVDHIVGGPGYRSDLAATPGPCRRPLHFSAN
jgi:hypothetical protein